MESSTPSDEDETSSQPFRFFDLPGELRLKILRLVLLVDRVIDIDFNAVRRIFVFLVCKRFHDEAAAVFFGGNAFRLLPVQGKAASKRTQPLIKQFAPRYRSVVTSMELRLGPFWTKPPSCWIIDDNTGLKDAISLRVLKVFVECDPSHPMYNGFRKSKDFYTTFCGNLMEQIVRRLPNLKEVQLDSYSGVSREGPLVQRLVREVRSTGKKVSWASVPEDDIIVHTFEKVSNSPMFVDTLLIIKTAERKYSSGDGPILFVRSSTAVCMSLLRMT